MRSRAASMTANSSASVVWSISPATITLLHITNDSSILCRRSDGFKGRRRLSSEFRPISGTSGEECLPHVLVATNPRRHGEDRRLGKAQVLHQDVVAHHRPLDRDELL